MAFICSQEASYEFDFETNFWNNVTHMTRFYFPISYVKFGHIWQMYYFIRCCPVAMEKKRTSLSQLIPGTLATQHLQSCKLDVSDCGLCAVHESGKLHQREWVRATLEDGVAKLWDAQFAAGQAWMAHGLNSSKRTGTKSPRLISKLWKVILTEMSCIWHHRKNCFKRSSEHDARSVSASRWSDFRQGNKNVMGTDRSHFGRNRKIAVTVSLLGTDERRTQRKAAGKVSGQYSQTCQT